MPVHLFGRPAPLDELARLGLPVIEDAAQAFGAAGDRDDGRLLDLQLLPDEEPLRARRRRPRSRSTTTSVAERVRMLRFHGSREKDVRLRRLQLAPRRDPGGGAAHLPAAARRLERRAPRGRRALRGARPRRGSSSCRPTSRATSTTCTCVRSPERDRLAAALEEAGIGSAAYYVTPLHLQPALALPRLLARVASRRRRRPSRENLCLPMWAGIDARRSRSEVVAVRAGARRARHGCRRCDSRSTDTGSGSSPSTRALIAAAWTARRSTCASTRRRPALLPAPARLADRSRSSSRSSWPSSSSSASTTAGGATSRRATCGAQRRRRHGRLRRRRPRRSTAFPPVHDLAAAALVAVLDFLLLLALRRRLAPARAHADRAAARRAHRRPRQGGADRRRRRRRPADRARDAAQPTARTTRRSASSTTTRASANLASTACACSARPTTCRTSCATTSPTRC